MKTGILLCKMILLTVVLVSQSFAASSISGANAGVAIGGYDAVAYFTDGKPRLGRVDFATEWQGAVWRFSNAEHVQLFKATPEKYAPQYGGYCAYAMANGGLAAGDGKRWRIVNDKLYLNNNLLAQKLWEQNVAENIVQADNHYPAVKARLEAGQ